MNITVSPHPIRTKKPEELTAFVPQEFDAPMQSIPINQAKPKVHDYNEKFPSSDPVAVHLFAFFCLGCQHEHAFRVGGDRGDGRPRWTFNGSLDRPTFAPSLLCNADHPPSRCHLFLRDGKIEYLADCHHALASKTVECPDWEE